MEQPIGKNDSSKQADFWKDMEEEYRKEREYYENLRLQGLENMPAIKCYRVIRSHLRNMIEQDSAETSFEPIEQNLLSVVDARDKAFSFADNLLHEIQEAIIRGLTDFQLMPASANDTHSLHDKTIISVYVTVIYNGEFTSVDMTDYEVLHSDEEVIYMPNETEAELEEMREALNREAHSLRNIYGADTTLIRALNVEDFQVLITDYNRWKEKGYIA